MKLPIFGKFSNSKREFHPKIQPYFWNSRIQEYFKTAGIIKTGVSLLSMKLSVLRELSHFQGELQSERFPRLSNSKILDYFKIAGILIWRGFNIFQKNETPDFWTIFKLREGVSFRNFPLFLEFQNSGVFQNRGNISRGSFITLGETLCTQGAESDGGSFIQTPPPRIPDFWNSWIREYFRTAGMSRRGSFITLPQTVCTQVAESIGRRVTSL